MSQARAHDHELEVLEEDRTVPPCATVPPRAEEQFAEVRGDGPTAGAPDTEGAP